MFKDSTADKADLEIRLDQFLARSNKKGNVYAVGEGISLSVDSHWKRGRVDFDMNLS